MLSEISDPLTCTMVEILKRAETEPLKNNLIAVVQILATTESGIQCLLQSEISLAIKTVLLSSNQCIQVTAFTVLNKCYR